MKSLAPLTVLLAVLAWWLLPYPAGLVVPCLLLFACSFVALRLIHDAPPAGAGPGGAS
jgi:hypothetical protein